MTTILISLLLLSIPHYTEKKCGGKGSRKLVELTLFITVVIWHVFLLDHSKCYVFFLNQKNKPTSGTPLPMTLFM